METNHNEIEDDLEVEELEISSIPNKDEIELDVSNSSKFSDEIEFIPNNEISNDSDDIELLDIEEDNDDFIEFTDIIPTKELYSIKEGDDLLEIEEIDELEIEENLNLESIKDSPSEEIIFEPRKLVESFVNSFQDSYSRVYLCIEEICSKEGKVVNELTRAMEEIPPILNKYNICSLFRVSISHFITEISSNIDIGDNNSGHVEELLNEFNLIDHDNNLSRILKNPNSSERAKLIKMDRDKIDFISSQLNPNNPVLKLKDITLSYVASEDTFKCSRLVFINLVNELKNKIISCRLVMEKDSNFSRVSEVLRLVNMNIGDYIKIYRKICSSTFEILDNVSYSYMDGLKDFDTREFVCGKCHSVGKFSTPLCSCIKLNKGGRFSFIPGFGICPECGEVNLLPARFYQDFERYCNSNKSFGVDIKADAKLDSVVYRINPSKLLCEPYMISSEEIETEEIKSLLDKSLLSDILAYRNRIDSLSLNKSNISEEAKNIKLNNETMTSKIISVILCGVVGEDYSLLKKNSINSFVDFIISNDSMYDILSIESTSKRNALVRSLDLVNFKEDVDSSSLLRLRNSICDDNQVTGNLIEDIKNKSVQFKKDCDVFNKLEKSVLNSMIIDYKLFSFIPIMNRCYSDTKGDKLLCNKNVLDFVDKVSDEMILSYLCEKLFNIYIDQNSLLGKYTSKLKEGLISGIKPLEKLPGLKPYSKLISSDFDLSVYSSKELMNLIKSLDICLKTRGVYEVILGLVDMYDFMCSQDNKSFKVNFYLKGLFNILNENIAGYKNLINKYGKSDEEVAFYYYGNVFTLEEIRSSNLNLSNIKIPRFVLERKEKETFKDYYNRLIRFEKDFDESKVELKDKYYVFNEPVSSIIIYPLLSYIYSLNSFICITSKDKTVQFLKFRLILNYLTEIGFKEVSEIFQISNGTINKILNREYFEIHSPKDSKRIKIHEEMLNLIYNNNDINELIDLSEGEYENFIGKLEDTEDLLDSIKYLPEEYVKLIRENIR